MPILFHIGRYSRDGPGRFLPLIWNIAALGAVFIPFPANARFDAVVAVEGQPIFPIGFYELPAEDSALEAMADAGVNLVRCHSRTDLDRAAKVGMLGVYTVPLQEGDSEALRKRIEEVVDHPILAVWEGPDEVVWNFTAFSGLHRTMGIYSSGDDWWNQSPVARKYSEDQGREIIPKMREAAGMIRAIDSRNRPIWINEALKSDVRWVREYLGFIDITGCDTYPVKNNGRPLHSIGDAVERWKRVGRGKPVWMVLQGFSWHLPGDYYGVKEVRYPSFQESRFMAYDAIAHGADAILYWGSHYSITEDFRESLYALTGELAKLQPFLVAPGADGVGIELIELPNESARGVRGIARENGEDFLIILVNEDESRHMGVEVSGLESYEGQTLHHLYGEETLVVKGGEIIVRMQPYEVRIYSTSRKWEASSRAGREYGQGLE